MRAGVELLTLDNALRLVEMARAEADVVLGIDAFVLRGTSVMPLMDWIADFSDAATSPGASARTCESGTAFLVALAAAGLEGELRVEVSLAS